MDCLSIEIFLWKQFPDSIPTVMAMKEGESPQEAIERYFSKMNSTKSLSDLIAKSDIQDFVNEDGELQFQYGEFQEFKLTYERINFIVVTNELREMYSAPYNSRIQNVSARLKKYGADVIMLPVVHDLGLNASEAKEYRAKIFQAFDADLLLGGDDIDPYLYGEKKSYANNPIRKRDVSELKFVRGFIEAKKGISFGICRGHQMCAVANGKKLYQDIQLEKEAPAHHVKGEHPILIDRSSDTFSIFDYEEITVNSLHHQEVQVLDNDPDYKITAKSLDDIPVVEALEFRNGLGVTLQFHPELMYDDIGEKIIERFVLLAKRTKAQRLSCYNFIELFR